MEIIIILVAVALLFFPGLAFFLRKYLGRINNAVKTKPARSAMAAENISGVTPGSNPPRLYPSVLQESTVPQRVVSADRRLESKLTMSPAAQPQSRRQKGLRKVQALPPLKKALVWADILSPPKALREVDFHE